MMKDGVPIEVVIFLLSGLYAFMLLFWFKIDSIWKVISHIEKDYVEHDVCHTRRKECPCKRDIERIEKVINETGKSRKI